MKTMNLMAPIDPVSHYSRMLRNDKCYQELRYIDPISAKEIIKDNEMADKLLKHPNFMIRTIYARIATNLLHINILRQDGDACVRDGLLQNPLHVTRL